MESELSSIFSLKDNCFGSSYVSFNSHNSRFGHSQVNTLLFRLQKNGNPIPQGHALLRDVYFKPNRLENEGGVDPLLRGAVTFPAQEIDLLMVDEMRDNLFPQDSASPGRQTGFDLAAFNIQRGRDHGIADLNSVRKAIGLKGWLFLFLYFIRYVQTYEIKTMLLKRR